MMPIKMDKIYIARIIRMNSVHAVMIARVKRKGNNESESKNKFHE